MTRFSLVLMLIACIGMSVGTVFAQDSGGTVRGQIVDTTTAQSPIEGVEVKIVAQSGEEFEALTDANGDYERFWYSSRSLPHQYLQRRLWRPAW